MFHGHLDSFQEPSLGGRPITKLGDHGTPNAHNRWLFLYYHGWGCTRIEINWNGIWLRTRSHVISYYTWEPVTTLHDFGGVLGRWPLDTLFWALTISWSRLVARVKWPLIATPYRVQALQGNNGRIDKTCPNQDVINDKKKLIENWQKNWQISVTWTNYC